MIIRFIFKDEDAYIFCSKALDGKLKFRKINTSIIYEQI